MSRESQARIRFSIQTSQADVDFMEDWQKAGKGTYSIYWSMHANCMKLDVRRRTGTLQSPNFEDHIFRSYREAVHFLTVAEVSEE